MVKIDLLAIASSGSLALSNAKYEVTLYEQCQRSKRRGVADAAAPHIGAERSGRISAIQQPA